MTLFQIFELVRFVCNKDFDGNIVTPERFQMLLPVVNMDMFRKKTGLPEQYQPGRPVPVEFTDITLKNTDDLIPFKSFLPNTSVVNGVLPYPNDYAHRTTISYNYTKMINKVTTSLPRPVEILREEEFASRTGNYTKQPTLANPIGTVRSDGIHIRPLTITSVDFHYLRYPLDPVFQYTLNDGYISDRAGSVQFEWAQDEHIVLVRMILSYVGINLRESDIVQYSEQKLQTG